MKATTDGTLATLSFDALDQLLWSGADGADGADGVLVERLLRLVGGYAMGLCTEAAQMQGAARGQGRDKPPPVRRLSTLGQLHNAASSHEERTSAGGAPSSAVGEAAAEAPAAPGLVRMGTFYDNMLRRQQRASQESVGGAPPESPRRAAAASSSAPSASAEADSDGESPHRRASIQQVQVLHAQALGRLEKCQAQLRESEEKARAQEARIAELEAQLSRGGGGEGHVTWGREVRDSLRPKEGGGDRSGSGGGGTSVNELEHEAMMRVRPRPRPLCPAPPCPSPVSFPPCPSPVPRPCAPRPRALPPCVLLPVPRARLLTRLAPVAAPLATRRGRRWRRSAERTRSW